jgi:hypothetical protein
MAYNPLHDPETPPSPPCSLDAELQFARQAIDKYAGVNIHDHTAIVKAAAVLDYHLRALVAAVEAERGER